MSLNLSESPRPAATELDSESETMLVVSSDDSDSDSDLVISGTYESALGFWIRTDTRFAMLYSNIDAHEPRLTFQLAEIGSRDRTDAQVLHCKLVIGDVLTRGSVAKFKIGITYVPLHRWRHASYSYVSQGYHRMIVMCAHDSSDVIANIEIELISHFRMHSRAGLVNPLGNALCANRSPGGESGHHGISPFFVYAVFAWNGALSSDPHYVHIMPGRVAAESQ